MVRLCVCSTRVAELNNNVLPFIRDFSARHRYQLEMTGPKDGWHPSWSPYFRRLEADDDFVIAWSNSLIPLPHAPSLADWLDVNQISCRVERCGRRRSQWLARTGYGGPAPRAVADELFVALPAIAILKIKELISNCPPHARQFPVELSLGDFLRSNKGISVPMDPSWMTRSERFIDLGQLQHVFAIAPTGGKYHRQYVTTVVHDQYYGPNEASWHGGQLIAILAPLLGGKPQGAEIGVFRGDTSRQLLRRFPKLELVMADTWSTHEAESLYRKSQDASALRTAQEQEQHYQAALTNTSFAEGRRRVLRMPSIAAAETISTGSLDFAFIDAAHHYEAVRDDIRAWWPKIRSGGLLCGHDFGHARDRKGLWGVGRAVNEFGSELGLRVNLGKHTIWWIAKP